MHRIAATALALALATGGLGAAATAGPATADPNGSSAPCPAVPADRVSSAIKRLPPPFPDRPEIGWVQTGHGSSIDCTLNWVQVYSAGATGSSPTQIILFDHFKEAGTVTRKPTAFTSVEPWIVPGQILVHFKWLKPGEPTANPTGSQYVRYQREEQRPPHPIDPLPRQALAR